MSLKNNIRTIAAVTLASMALKSATAQNNKNVQAQFKGITITPAAFALEVSDGTKFPYVTQGAALNFGLNRDFAFSPYLSVSGNLTNVWVPTKSTPDFHKRLTVNTGVGKKLGPVGISADAGVGAMDGDVFYQFNLSCGYKICDFNKNVSASIFAGGYYEKFNNTPFAIGIIAGISLGLTK
ncbi:MAG: hypothetical protein LBJ73_01490 [Rickettsiales bacterium]|jgi:hypothetical protein|nr:hypothetical protein [Rickettsiales bacterium]